MPILGIDLGSSASVVATVGRGGVAIVRNDLADRLTPTLVSYTDTERLTGDVALARWKSNATRTCRGFMNLLGIPSDEEFKDLIQLENEFSLVRLDTSELGNGLIGYDLENSSYGVQCATQVLGCYLKRLKELGNNYFGCSNSIHGVVIGVPSWLPDSSRQAVLDACALADLNCLKVLNTGSAIALDYGLFRSHTFEAGNPQYVSFVDIGYSSACVTIVEYQPSQLQILSVHQDLTLGGRTLDKIITERCVEVLKPTQELSCKARLRLEESSEKIKKVLSANRESSVNLECLIGESDFEFTLTRDEFERITEDYQAKLRALLAKAKSSLQSDKVLTVEICGGITRIPFVQSLIEKVFESNVSKTLSSDECVARGAAIQAAMLDPHHRVKEFTVIDKRFTPVFIVLNHNAFLNANETSVESEEVAKDETVTLFEAGTPNYFVKWLTFPNILPPGKVMSIYTLMDAKKITLGEVILPEIDAADIKDTNRIKMRFMNDIHGIVRVEALLVSDRQVQEPFFEAETYTDEQGAEATRTVEKTRTKVLCDKKQLNIELVRPRGWLAKDEINLIYNQELKMAANDQSTINARNMLNQILANCFQYRIDMTNDKPDSPAIYASNEEREQIIKITHEVEEWIELNHELSVDEYQPVLLKLQTVWEPVYSRKVAADKIREEAEAKARAEAKAKAEAEAAESKAAKATEEFTAMKSPATCETDEQSITVDEQI